MPKGGMSDIPTEPRFVIPCIRSMKCYQKRFQLQIKKQVSDYVELRAFRGMSDMTTYKQNHKRKKRSSH
ncbi:hypothetical protein KUTeg_005433 [Tegillarca granosa]|uniref:Uncharacterized protein n=1 Tax=Tegillarca granosa TaxID=220873 RepID=A0ABQ9FJR4_TEGGR|nr:hypothetical protein KUTeg_005433 [Tegillarca granosa]